jgi:hypothetical protein
MQRIADCSNEENRPLSFHPSIHHTVLEQPQSRPWTLIWPRTSILTSVFFFKPSTPVSGTLSRSCWDQTLWSSLQFLKRSRDRLISTAWRFSMPQSVSTRRLDLSGWFFVWLHFRLGLSTVSTEHPSTSPLQFGRTLRQFHCWFIHAERRAQFKMLMARPHSTLLAILIGKH